MKLLQIAFILLLSFTTGTLASSQSISGHSMVCEDLKRGYSYWMVYDPAKRVLTLEANGMLTYYPILAVERSPPFVIVAGIVGQKSNLVYRATFSQVGKAAHFNKIEYFNNETLIQTDLCMKIL